MLICRYKHTIFFSICCREISNYHLYQMPGLRQNQAKNIMIQGLFLTVDLKHYPSILELAQNIAHIQTCYLDAYPYLFSINSCWIMLSYFVNMLFITSGVISFILCHPLFSLFTPHGKIYYLKHLMPVIGRIWFWDWQSL